MIHISKGNSKLGNIPNLSLPPVKACPNSKWCFQKELHLKCYAMKFYIMRPLVKKAWDDNYQLAQENPNQFELEVNEWLHKHRPEYFRVHVGGDFFNQQYLNNWEHIAQENPNTKFRAFTKAFELDFSEKPSNLNIGYSVMPNMNLDEVPTKKGLKAYTGDLSLFVNHIDKDEKVFECKGSCADCKICWELKENQSVIFHIH